MLTLITGAPGSSKTSHVISKLMDITDRPIFHRGIKGLTLPWTELTDEETNLWYENIPDGSILIVDEVQDIWPQRPLSKPAPKACTEFSKHRHRGVDIYLITQHPTGVDHEARKYVNEHIHLTRPFGAPFVNRYHKGSGVIAISDPKDLATCNLERVKLPKKTWDLYKSAEVHTHKFRLPKKVFLAIPIILLLAFSFWRFFDFLNRDTLADQTTQQFSVDNINPLANPSNFPTQTTYTSFNYDSMSTDQWLHAYNPQVQGLPFTAPLYGEASLEIKSVPVIHGCMSFQADLSDCTCYTQQGTRIPDMPLSMCHVALKDGFFNHLADDKNFESNHSGLEGSSSGERRRSDSPRLAADSNI